MKRKLMVVVMVFVSALTLAPVTPRAQSSAEQQELRNALELEKVKGDREGALEVYIRLANSADRKVSEVAREAIKRLGGVPAAPQRTPGNPFPVVDIAGEPRGHRSPDGRYISFARPGNAFERQFFLRDTRTGLERVVLAERGDYGTGVWSPDSSHVVTWFRKSGKALADVVLVGAATGEARVLVTAFPQSGIVLKVAWSPDGKRIALSPPSLSSQGPQSQVFVVDVASGAMTPLSTNGVLADSNVSPWTTGGLVVEIIGRRWLLVNPTDGSSREICAETPNWEPSPQGCHGVTLDGRVQVVQKRDPRRIVLRDTTTGREWRLTDGTGDEQYLALSPDGKLVAFEANHDGAWGVWVAPVESTPVGSPVKIAALTREGGSSGDRWDHDGRLSLGLDFNDRDVYRVEVDAGTGRAKSAPRRLTQDAPSNGRAVVSPDSSRIAYWAHASGKGGVALMDASGGGERVVLERAGDFWAQLAWLSADELMVPAVPPIAANASRWSVFQIRSQQIRTPLFNGAVQVVECGARERLDEQWRVDTAVISATREIVYRHCPSRDRASHTLRARSSQTGRDRQLIAPGRSFQSFAVSPDGRSVIYVHHKDPAPGQSSLSAAKELWLAQGESQRPLLGSDSVFSQTAGNGRGLAWSPDGRFVVFRAYSTLTRPRIWTLHVLSLESGESWPLVTTPTEFSSLDDPNWSPDGSFIVMTGEAQRHEWRQWTGVTADAVQKVIAALRRPR